jgi:hypothetical protein
MKIEYVYQEPKEKPIEKAEFKVFGPCDVAVEVIERGSFIYITHRYGEYVVTARYARVDFADFCALVNRINRQINGGA